jgi:hypothetical protein
MATSYFTKKGEFMTTNNDHNSTPWSRPVYSFEGKVLCRIEGNNLIKDDDFSMVTYNDESVWVIERQLVELAKLSEIPSIVFKDWKTGTIWVTLTSKVRRYGIPIRWGIGGGYVLPSTHWIELSPDLLRFQGFESP